VILWPQTTTAASGSHGPARKQAHPSLSDDQRGDAHGSRTAGRARRLLRVESMQ